MSNAPSKSDVARNAAAYEGTSFDPLLAVVPHKAIENFGTQDYSGEHVFAEWYKADTEGAMSWFASVYGEPLLLANLSDAQRVRMGLMQPPAA